MLFYVFAFLHVLFSLPRLSAECEGTKCNAVFMCVWVGVRVGGTGELHLVVTEVAAVGNCAVEKSSCTARYLNEQLKWSGVQLSVFLFLSPPPPPPPPHPSPVPALPTGLDFEHTFCSSLLGTHLRLPLNWFVFILTHLNWPIRSGVS